MDTQRILVTGATGFLGRHLITLLLRAGYQVIVIDRHPNPGLKVERYFEGDIVRSDVLKKIDCPIDQIIHLAADVDRCNNYDCMLDNVYSTYVLCQSAIAWQTKRVILASTSAVYDSSKGELIVDENYPIKPVGLYGLTKYLAEVVVQTSDLSKIVLRFPYLYGEDDTASSLFEIIRTIKMGKPPKVRHESRDYLYVGDAADSILKSLTYQGKSSIFNIGTGTLTSMRIIAKKVCETMGVNTDIIIAGQRCNVALDSRLAGEEMQWKPSTDIIRDLQQIVLSIVGAG